jgi:hypothetical protein
MTLTILDPRSGQQVTITVPDVPPSQEAVMKQSSMRRAQHRLFRQLGKATSHRLRATGAKPPKSSALPGIHACHQSSERSFGSSRANGVIARQSRTGPSVN